MSAHVLLSLLNELGERDKMRGLPSSLSFFANKFKAAYSVTFDLLILKIMFLFFKNTVKILKFR